MQGTFADDFVGSIIQAWIRRRSQLFTVVTAWRKSNLHDTDGGPDIVFDRSNQLGIAASTMDFSSFLFTFNNDYRKKKAL